MKNDEIIISALITAPTIRAAAESLDMSESQLYARLRDSEFRQRYAEAKTAILKAAESEAITKLTSAINGLWDIATSSWGIQHRMKAYELVINAALKIADYSHKADRETVADLIEDQNAGTVNQITEAAPAATAE